MTASELIVACCALDVGLSAENGILQVSDPKQRLTAAFKAELAKHEAEVAAMVGTKPSAAMAAMVVGGEDAYDHARGAHQHHRMRHERGISPWFASGLVAVLLAAVALVVWAFRLR